MSARLLDGKSLAETIIAGIKQEVTARSAKQHRVPGLAVILVGDDSASGLYVKIHVWPARMRACDLSPVT